MNSPAQPDIPLVIESISERLEIKQDFFQTHSIEVVVRSIAPLHPICRSSSICRTRGYVACIFMPVHDRHAVEVASSPASDPETLPSCFPCDAPEKAANSLNSPGSMYVGTYLNESMLLLCRCSARVIEKVAKQYGMPISPLELIDWIAPRTAFDAGRAFWRSFLIHSPSLPA